VRHAGEIHAWPGTHQELPGRIHIVLVRQPVGSWTAKPAQIRPQAPRAPSPDPDHQPHARQPMRRRIRHAPKAG